MSLEHKKRKVYFVGIGGIGMSGIAELLLNLNHEVSGSDYRHSDTLEALTSKGAKIQVGHGVEFISEIMPDVVVYSSAISADNPEMSWAKQNRIPMIRRAEMLAELMRLKRSVAVAGSHGKTSTTALLSLIFKEAQLEPTVVIGGRFDALGSNAYLGKGDWLIAEADESDASFLRLSPEFMVVTNIDREHMEHYGRFEGLINAFEEFIDKTPFYGLAVLCTDCPHLKTLSCRLKKPCVTYGFDLSQSPDFHVKLLDETFPYNFEIFSKKDSYSKSILKLRLCVPGKHHVLNAAGAAVLAYSLEIDASFIEKALADFKGVQRRFQGHGKYLDVHPIVEDYAHHPTEIRATLQAALDFFNGQKPVVLFQPHRYTRTRDLWPEFSHCFEGSSYVMTLPIYAASEPRDEWTYNIDGQNFSSNIQGPPAQFFDDQEELLKKLEGFLQFKESTPILVLGAGDVWKIIPKLKQGKVR